ncbi:MAG: S24/S26 family peptidase [Marinilabiliales bacterium]|nr:S24/S26 family peptidase [Marinilabiliales bacterium]
METPSTKPTLLLSEDEMTGLLADLLKDGKQVHIPVRGYSMAPFLWNRGERVLLSKATTEELVRGTLVVFKYQGRFVVHRILLRRENQLILAGDSIYGVKEMIPLDQVVGVVREIIYTENKILSTASFRWRFCSSTWLLCKPLMRFPLRLIIRIRNHFGLKSSGDPTGIPTTHS